MRARVAHCHCGDLELRCEGQPTKVSMCHCRDCQRRTGSAFSVAVFYRRDQVRIAGEPKRYERQAASGRPVEFCFCGRCGANVYWLPSRLPDLIGIAMGAFADPAFPQPDQSVWGKDRHGWVVIPDGVLQYEENPPPRTPLTAGR